MDKHPWQGFTLIEVVMVVGVIAIITLIAIPNFLMIRQRAGASICVRNLRQIEAALEQYAIDCKKSNGDTLAWTQIVPTYMKRIPECPAGGAYQTSGSPPDKFVIGDTVSCSIGTDNPLIDWDDHIYH